MRICRLVAGFPTAQQTSIDGVAAPGPMSLTQVQVTSGIEVHVICAGYPKLTRYEFKDGIHIYRVPWIRVNPLRMDLMSYGISATFEMLRLNSSLSFDIIHGHGYDPAVSFLCKALMRGKTGFLISVHMTQIGKNLKITPVDPELLNFVESCPGILLIKQPNEKLPWDMNLMLEYMTYRNADRLLANSESTAKELTEYYRIPRERISVVYAGVDTRKFHPNIEKRGIIDWLGLHKNRIILCVAAFSQRKGVQYLISAIPTILQAIPDSKFVFVGKGALKPFLQRLVKNLELGNSVRFLGTVQYECMPSLYSVADLVVLPSVYEPFGKVLAEAMASGKPVVATRVSGIPEVVLENETGILVPSKRADLLARAIIEVLSDSRLANKMALKARERAVKLFSWEKVAERVLRAYEETLMEKR